MAHCRRGQGALRLIRTPVPLSSRRTPAPPAEKRPAVFLDRDGVINVDNGYTYRPEDLIFTPTAIEAVGALNAAGFLVVVVTNQSGVARGLYGEEDVLLFHEHMQAALAVHDAHIDAFYYCAFHPNGCVPEFTGDHEDRKPNPGMIKRAMRDWPIRTRGSFMIGDKPSDVEAARRAGLPALQVDTNSCDLLLTVRRYLQWS